MKIKQPQNILIKIANKIDGCPICDCERISYIDEFLLIKTTDGNHFPVVILSCTNCHHMMQFSAISLGAMDKNGNDTTEHMLTTSEAQSINKNLDKEINDL